jgi:hypothetical protein
MWTRSRRELAFAACVAVLIPASLLASIPAIAVLHVGTQVSCQTQANPGGMVSVDVRLENAECVALDVRIISTVVGNSDQTMNELGVFGPVLAGGAAISVPAARDRTPGYCDPNTNRCGGWGGTGDLDCSTDADCFCRLFTPAVLNISQAVPPALPASLEDTVVTQLITVEWDGGTKMHVEKCLIELPEPSSSLQLVTGILGLLALSRLRPTGIGFHCPRRRSSGQRERAGGTNKLKENPT